MLYLVYVLTFLAGILFYAFYPRDDQVNLDTYRAEGFIVSFLAQHQAAKDYMTQWLGFNLNGVATNYFSLNDASDKFIGFTPYVMDVNDVGDYQGSTDYMAHDPAKMTTTQNADQSFGFMTTVFCEGSEKDGNGFNMLTRCNNSDPANRLQQAYLVTYNMHRPTWWPQKESNRQRRYGTWRKALARRTSGSYNCGVLHCGQSWDNAAALCRTGTGAANALGYWCVDNGQTLRLPGTRTCAQKVPLGITNEMGCQETVVVVIDGEETEVNPCNDAFFCISQVKQGPDNYYVPGLTAFYDGINNRNQGVDDQEAKGGRTEDAAPWVDLKRPGKEASSYGGGDVPFRGLNPETLMASQNGGVVFPDLQIVSKTGAVFRPFTLTTLLKGFGDKSTDTNIAFALYNGTTLSPLQLIVENNEDTASVYFQLEGNPVGTDGEIPFTLYNSKADQQDSQNVNQRILSLTIIGDSDKLAVYANASGTPVATLPRATWEALPSRYNYESTMMLMPHLAIFSNTGGEVRIYGVRYYRNKSLTVHRKHKNGGGFEASEVEQNFARDSKRYGIATLCDRRSLHVCLQAAATPGDRDACHHRYFMCPSYE